MNEALTRPILGLSARVVRLPLREPVRTAIHDASELDHVLVRLHAEGGISGIGHLFTFGAGWARALEAMVQELGSRIVGSDATDVAGVGAKLWAAATFMGHRGAAAMAVAAIDTALWDILGQVRAEPLWSLLGGRARPLPCYASDTLWLGDRVESLPLSAQRRVAEGFGAVKVRVGSADSAGDERRVSAVREAIGPGVTLMADANQGWNRDQAIETGRRLAGYGLYWLEEPVPAYDYESLAPIRAATGIPIATGESWFGMLDVVPGLAGGAVSTLMPDLERIGGVSAWMEAAAAARAAGARVSPHLFPEVSVHLMAAQPDDHFIEYVPWFSELFQDPPLPSDGRLAPTDRPGLGLRFRPEVFPI